MYESYLKQEWNVVNLSSIYIEFISPISYFIELFYELRYLHIVVNHSSRSFLLLFDFLFIRQSTFNTFLLQFYIQWGRWWCQFVHFLCEIICFFYSILSLLLERIRNSFIDLSRLLLLKLCNTWHLSFSRFFLRVFFLDDFWEWESVRCRVAVIMIVGFLFCLGGFKIFFKLLISFFDIFFCILSCLFYNLLD